MPKNQDREPKVIGLIPAAGQARRIAPLPLSQEFYPMEDLSKVIANLDRVAVRAYAKLFDKSFHNC